MPEIKSTCTCCEENLCQQIDYPWCDGWYKTNSYIPEPDPEVEEGRFYVYGVSDGTVMCMMCFEEIWNDLVKLTAPKDVCKICGNPDTLFISTYKVAGQRWEPCDDADQYFADDYYNILITEPFPVTKDSHVCICKHCLERIRNL